MSKTHGGDALRAVTENEAKVAPAGMVMLAGTVTLLLVAVTETTVCTAIEASATVHAVVAPTTTLTGEQDSLVS